MSALSRSEQRQLTAAVKASMTSKSSSASKKGKVVRTNDASYYLKLSFYCSVRISSMGLRANPNLVKNRLSQRSVQERPNQAAAAAAAAAAAMRWMQ
jgi:hypothetical protein